MTIPIDVSDTVFVNNTSGGYIGPIQQPGIFTTSTFYLAIRLSEPFGTVSSGRGLNHRYLAANPNTSLSSIFSIFHKHER
jgi:hypothetical protein